MTKGLTVELTTGQKLWADSCNFEFEDGVLYLYDGEEDDANVVLAVPQEHVLSVMSHDHDPDAKPESVKCDTSCGTPDPGLGYRLIDRAVDTPQEDDEFLDDDVTPEAVCKREAFSGGGSPSPRECDVCGEGPCEKQPVESPDDWVTQNMVPYRYDYDQCRWRDGDEWLSQQILPIYYRHGCIGGGSLRLQVRCRRKDLPTIPAEIHIGDSVVITESPKREDSWDGCRRTVQAKVKNGYVVGKVGEPISRIYLERELRVIPKPDGE